MIYKNETTERDAALQTAFAMCAAARTAPKACGVDVIETLVVDGEDKDKLTAKMRELGGDNGMDFFIRDAGNCDACHAVVLIGAAVNPRGLDCEYCGVKTCEEAAKGGVDFTAREIAGVLVHKPLVKPDFAPVGRDFEHVVDFRINLSVVNQSCAFGQFLHHVLLRVRGFGYDVFVFRLGNGQVQHICRLYVRRLLKNGHEFRDVLSRGFEK